ncbi:BtrH N-terminal domain-containing protein [Actinophytocola sp.]|uniref:BtrH N-terminal domain-containing protein n=1 Tax=Actinophytocola sp. TaxID=1872138 RepID=UPI00389987A4
MTEHKALKRLVRERMARHGESYTTARRHVLAKAGRGGLPAGLLAGYDTFGVEWHRESALVAHVLRQAGTPVSEPVIAGLAGGIGFMYAVFDYKDMPPLLTIVAQHHPEPWAPAALRRLRVPFTEEHSGQPAAALRKLSAALDAGRPVLCTVDRSRLPWHGMEPGYGMDPYVVAVAGRDGDVLLVDDEAPRPNGIAVDDFLAAWSAHKKGSHHMLVVTGPPVEPDLGAAARDAVATTVAHLTGPVLGNNFDVNFGFSGMARLAVQLRDTRTRTGWAKRFGAPVPFYHGVRRLYECVELEYTAPGATRPTYARFLAEMANDVPGAGAAAELFARSGDTWSRLAGLALETTGALGEYAEVAERRLAVMLSRGPEARAEIRELTVRMDELASEYRDPLGDAGRAELFARLADLVEECLETEREAVALLSPQ